MKRRSFIKSTLTGSMTLLLPIQYSGNQVLEENKRNLRFGICADIHQDIMHDGESRLEAFIDNAINKEFDFIIQLGDFCIPKDDNLNFMSIWNSFPRKKYHVLGNHDMDGGYTFDQVVNYWKAEAPFYSFDLKGYHFIVINGNEVDPSPNRPVGYARFISDSQLDWLTKDLEQTNLPTFVFCHQGLDNDLGGIDNATKSRLVLESANKKSGFDKVKAVFSGHHHQDYHNEINGINYIQINSMSYQWLGEKYQHIRYSDAVDKLKPLIKLTVPYEKAIWAEVEITNNQVQIQGMETKFVGPSPEDLGMAKNEYGYPIVPKISDRKVKI